MNADWAASQSQYCSMIQKMACPNWGLLWRDAGWWLIATSKLSVVKIPGKHCDRWNVVAWKPKNLRSKEKMPLTDERMWLSWRCALKFGLDGSLVEAEHHPFREHPDYVSIHDEQINTSQISQTRSNLDQQHSHSSRIWHVWILRWNTKWICIEAFWVTASLTLRRSGTKHHSKHPLNKIWERWMRKKNPNGLNGKWCCIVTQSNRAELHHGISQFYNQWFWICWSGIVNILLDLIEIKSGQNSGMILGGICTCTIIEH